MRVIRLKTILKRMFENKKRLAVVLILSIAVFGLLGVRGVRKAEADADAKVAEYESQVAQYNATLEQYDTSLAAQQENLVRIQEQYDKQKEYCDNSIYMKLDATGIYYGQLQMGVETEANVGYIISSLMTYASGADFFKNVAEMTGEEPDYLKEVIIPSYSANIFIITVMHYDEEQAARLLDAVGKTIKDKVPDIAKTQGDFKLNIIEQSVNKRADISVLNAQNGNINNLRSYTTNLADAESATIRSEADKNVYANEHAVEPVYPLGSTGKIKILLKYLILGFFVAFIVLMIWEILRTVFAKNIDDLDYFTALGISDMGCIMGDDTEAFITDTLLSIHAKADSKVYLNGLSETEASLELLSKITGKLKEKGLEADFGTLKADDASSLESAADKRNMIAVVEKGEATYLNAEKMIEYAERYGLSIVGAILWEKN